ncbi:MAG: 8-amino-7-oxononanoate synthase [Polyangiaceae bacterium]|nr:8-amino-7-oxononanoate synthase [Polyangiaceae bacterium]
MKHLDDPLGHLPGALAEIERLGLYRRPAEADDAIEADALTFCSNDYLGLASTKAPASASGTGSSRLISGERSEHRQLERTLANWLGVEDALVFTSGYAANVGTISALAGPSDLLVSDALNHASIIDGARLSKSRVVVTPHLDLAAIDEALASRREPRAWVVVESYYSMDADGPDLAALRAVSDARHAGLIVDEAHALGVLGPGGRGRSAEAGVVPDALVGTLGKSLGSQGAFVAGRSILRDWLWNRARSFVFSTGLAPSAAAAATRALEILLHSPDLPAYVQRLAERLRTGLRDRVQQNAFVGAYDHTPLHATANKTHIRGAPLWPPHIGHPQGVPLPRLIGFGHIVPVVIGKPEDAVRIADFARARGIHVTAIRPPTVPAGTARIRITVTARHNDEDIDRALDVLHAALSVVPVVEK